MGLPDKLYDSRGRKINVSEKKILLGNEATVRGTYETGVKISAAYPGIPSTEVSEALVQYDEVYAEWASNEKAAIEVVIGASVAEVCSMCMMKHVGMNVAADPLYTAVYTGVRGGMVLVVADDPGMYSSQNEQDNRMVAKAAMVPVVKLSDSAEAKELTKYAYDLSEEYDTPVLLRSTTRLSHSQGVVELEEWVEPFGIPYERDVVKYVMMPGNAIKRHLAAEARMKQPTLDTNELPINRVEYNDLSVGFITNSITCQYVKEAMPEVSILKLGLINPPPRKLIEEFALKVDKLYIFEELGPVVEEQVKAWGIAKAAGKEIFTIRDEYSANFIRERVLGQTPEMDKVAQVSTRPPILCPGYPHRSVYTVLNKLKIYVAGDIGYYTLGTIALLSVIDTTTCMGASISIFHGMEKAKGKDYIHNWVAVIGDSTFTHTGINSLMNMVYNQVMRTAIIPDNSTTGMTGHQGHAATGKTLKGQVVPAINIPGLCKSLGIEHVIGVDAFDQAELEKVIKEGVAREAVSAVITEAPYALLRGIKFPNKCKPAPDKCKKCGACLGPGCPTLTKNEDGLMSIDETTCSGCGLCIQLCKSDAIEQIKVGE